MRYFLALIIFLQALAAQAATVCTVSASAVNFGSYSPFYSLPLDTAGNVQVTCSGASNALVSYNILLSKGSSGSYSPRKLYLLAQSLNYNLYTTSARVTVWGDGTSGTSFISDSYHLAFGQNVRNYATYGRLPALQNIPAGSYSDTITVTVNY